MELKFLKKEFRIIICLLINLVVKNSYLDRFAVVVKRYGGGVVGLGALDFPEGVINAFLGRKK